MTIQLALERETARELYWSIPAVQVDSGKIVRNLRQKLGEAIDAVDEIDSDLDSDDALSNDKVRTALDVAMARIDEANNLLNTLAGLAEMNTTELRAALDRALYQ